MAYCTVSAFVMFRLQIIEKRTKISPEILNSLEKIVVFCLFWFFSPTTVSQVLLYISLL